MKSSEMHFCVKAIIVHDLDGLCNTGQHEKSQNPNRTLTDYFFAAGECDYVPCVRSEREFIFAFASRAVAMRISVMLVGFPASASSYPKATDAPSNAPALCA